MAKSSSVNEYLLLSRGRWDADKSPQEIQAAIDAFYAWHARLVAAGRFRPGQRLTRDAKLVTRNGILDGPYTEAKEVIGGYWFVLAASLEEAARIVADNPTLACGLAFEIRPIEPEQASAWREGNETPARGGAGA
ncbi:MAG: YciI family protein [Burkholderiales bacterium]